MVVSVSNDIQSDLIKVSDAINATQVNLRHTAGPSWNHP